MDFYRRTDDIAPSQQILALHYKWDRSLLDEGGLHPAELGNRLQDAVVEPHLVEGKYLLLVLLFRHLKWKRMYLSCTKLNTAKVLKD